jgi:cell wall-associated NlpC family hydrolase
LDIFGVANVPVAVLWTEPGEKRSFDDLILSCPNNPATWSDGLNDDMRLWLVGKVETQVLLGERLLITEERDNWLKVIATGQSSSLDHRGYPGWIPSCQVSRDETFLNDLLNFPLVVVSAPLAQVFSAAATTETLINVSYQTRLPLLTETNGMLAVRLPDGTTGYLAPQDARQATELIFSEEKLVDDARRFLNLRYIWGGTSAFGFDCSGFTMRLYQAQGIEIPRDADDQAAAGTPIEVADLMPGDLLFFASDAGHGSIHHVGLYTGDGKMIHAPNSRSAVREQPFTDSPYGKEFWGARRYVTL